MRKRLIEGCSRTEWQEPEVAQGCRVTEGRDIIWLWRDVDTDVQRDGEDNACRTVSYINVPAESGPTSTTPPLARSSVVYGTIDDSRCGSSTVAMWLLTESIAVPAGL